MLTRISYASLVKLYIYLVNDDRWIWILVSSSS